MPSVIVIGGGLAGLSSAVALAEAGCRVQLFEQRPQLGGRATSYSLPDGTEIDNCQHVTLGCCTNLDDFYRRVGAAGKIRWYDRLVFLDSLGRRGVIEASPLPPPFHLAPSFALFPSLTLLDKRGIAEAMLVIARAAGRPADAAGVTMLDWLHRHNQTRAAIERFWRVVLVSALNEEPDRADARYGAMVFWQAFLANRSGFRLGVPAVPLAKLYGGCRAAIEQRGGEVRTRSTVRGLRISGDRVCGVRFADGTEASADFYIAAVPHDVLLDLLPLEVVENDSVFHNLRNLQVSPITGVHLIFDRPVMREPFVTLLDRTVQWVFNKTRLYAEPAAAPGDGEQYLQLVISASYDLVEQPRQEIIDLCRAELAEALPETRAARLVKATVVKETAATFSPEPDGDRWRPGAETALSNLFLAGDWTATGWPGTMEGAVRSGYRAAEAILMRLGRPQNLLVPDLPAEGLARWLARE